MVAEKLISLSCAVCGDDWHHPASGIQRQYARMRALKRQLEDLEAGRTSVRNLKLHITDMCRDCQMLFVALNGEIDFLELRNRISERISELRAHTAQQRPGGAA